MARPAPWALPSAAAAPVLLVGGWTVAASRQPGVFDATTETISALAALDATDRGIMTAALLGTGACHVVTALGLRGEPRPARALLAVGGVATALVAVLPLPGAAGGAAAGHAVAAWTAFLAMAAWPALARTRGHALAAAVLLGLVGWFGAELALDGPRIGLAERVAAAAQSAYPLVAWWVAVRRSRS